MPSISYKHLQESALVRAAIVGSFTRPNVRQLIIFKEMALEVWDAKESPINISCTKIWLNVCNCVLLQNPWGYDNLSSTTLDQILVVGDKGNVGVLEWSVSGVRNAAIKLMCVKTDKMEPILNHSIFSNPLSLRGDTPLSSLFERSREKDDGAKSWFGKITNITLVAMAIYDSLIQVLVSAWTPDYHNQRTNVQGTIFDRPLLNEYHLKMEGEPAIGNRCSQLRKVPTILGLAFIKTLDWKAHPLLVMLVAHNGLIYDLVTVECFALDLVEGKIHKGPWKISNLHATSRFLLPWCQDGLRLAKHNCTKVARANKSMEEIGVLVISSKGLLFINLEGCRASISFTMCLEGPPSCVEIMKDHGLVLGYSSGVLYVVDLKQWDQHQMQQVTESNSYLQANILLLLQVREDKMRNVTNYMFFSSGKAKNLRFFSLYLPSMGGPGFVQDPYNGDEEDNFVKKSPAEFSLSSWNIGRYIKMCDMSWYTRESPTQLNIEQDLTCVRDMIMINDLEQSPQPLIMVACGSAPNATIHRGTFGVSFNKRMVLDIKIYNLPQTIPIQWNVHSEYHTHILLSYYAQDKTEIITMEGEIEQKSCIQGLDREHFTLAALVVLGGWLVQVTSYSVRVLDFSEQRRLVAEWAPPGTKSSKSILHDPHARERGFHHNIIHASLCMYGVVLATYNIVYSITLSKSGQVQTCGTNRRNYEVSTLGVFEFCMASENLDGNKKTKQNSKPLVTTNENANLSLIVVVAEWHTNKVHLLTWPELEEMTFTETGLAPVRCVHVTFLGNKHYLVVGNSVGHVLYFELKCEIPMRNMESQHITMNTYSSNLAPNQCPNSNVHDVGERESMSWLTRMSHFQSCSCHNGDCDQSLTRFSFKILPGKILKLGGSIKYMVSGLVCGPNIDSKVNMRSDNQNYLLIQGNQNFVLCSKEDGQLQALPIWASNQPLATLSRIHTINLLNGILCLLEDGHLALGHVSLSTKLHWQVTRLLGTPQQLAHHHGSGCIAISSNDSGFVRLSLIDIQSMCQVVTLELGSGQHPTTLKALKLPCVNTKGIEACKECIVVASKKSIKELAQGTIYFFEFNKWHSCDQEVQYKLSLLGIHYTNFPCHSMCLLGPQGNYLPNGICDICNTSTFVEDFEPLEKTLKHLSHGSEHWNDCFRHQQNKRGPIYYSGPLLVLGYKHHVEIFSIVIGINMTSILLAPSLAHAIQVVVPSLSGPIIQECYESSSPYVSDIESDHEDGSKFINIQAPKVPTKPSQQVTSMICLTKDIEFSSPGKTCVTAIVEISQSNFLVVEMLRGVGAFSIQDNAKVLQLAWHPFSHPILDLIPLNSHMYLVSTYDRGLQLIGRNYAAEQAFQDEEKRFCEEEVERGLVGVSLRRFNIDGIRHELPTFKVIASLPWPTTVLRMQDGNLNIPMENIIPDLKASSFENWHGVIVTSIGEVGVIEITLQDEAIELVN